MEDSRLNAAAQNGDVNELRNLMAGNPFLLKPAELTGGQNPLHFACMGGHLDFVKEVLFHNPGFAQELNRDGLSPLHIASAYGYLDIVKELLKVGPHLCLVEAKNSKTALHYAVVKGQIEVIDQLISACLPSIKEVTDEQETCFHMAVKYNQFEALEHLTHHVKSLSFGDAILILNRGNLQGNTILHLAASRTQNQVLDHLLLTIKPYLELNALNRQDLTPLDVFVSEAGRVEILEDQLKKSGAKHAADLWVRCRRLFDYENNIGKHTITMSNDTRNTLLVVLALIIAATYQAVISPPGGLWQDTIVLVGNNNVPLPYRDNHRSKLNSTEVPHVAGTSIFRTLNPLRFSWFFFFNTLGFTTSCALSLYLTAPHHMVVWFALVPMFVTYSISAGEVTRNEWVPVTVCVIIVILSIATHRFLSGLYSKINDTLCLGKYLYRVLYNALFKTK